MVEKKTTVVLEAQTKGFDRAKTEVRSAFREMDTEDSTEGFRELLGSVDSTFKAVASLAEGMRSLQQEMLKASDAGDFRQMVGGVKELTGAIEQMTGARKHDREEQKKERDEARRGREEQQRKRSSAFGMGVMQGAGFGEYFPEQGLSRNMAGRAAGSFGRGVFNAGFAGSVGSAFSGASGVSTALQGVPVVGGMFAGQLQATMAAAQEALGYEGVKMGLARYGFTGEGGSVTAKKPTFTADEKKFEAEFTAEERDQQVNRAIEQERAGEGAYGDYTELRDQEVKRRMALEKSIGPRAVAALDRVREGRFGEEKKMTRPSLFGVGANFGMALPETAQFAGQILETAGGAFQQLNARNLSTALGAERRYGVDAGTSGAFLRGGRTGGAGGQNGEQALVSALRAAVELGLQGSDLTAYMRDTAGALMAFDQTGIPIDIDSLAALQKGVALSGFGTQQGARIGRGLRDVGAEIGGGGPKNAAQMLIFRQMFGYQGGGVQDFFGASMKASQGKFQPGGFQNLLGSVMQGQGSDATEKNAIFLQQFLQQAGIQIGLPQAYDVARGDQTAIAATQRDIAAGAAASSGMTAEGIATAGIGATPGAMRTAAGVTNARIGAGQEMLPAMQEFEKAQSAMLRNASEFSGVVKILAENAKEISKSFGPGASKLADILEALAIRVGL